MSTEPPIQTPTLRDWRLANGLSLAAAAARLGIGGSNPATQFQRYETGQSRPDADMIELIRLATDGAVGAEAMHATRLAWLASRRGVADPAADHPADASSEAAA